MKNTLSALIISSINTRTSSGSTEIKSCNISLFINLLFDLYICAKFESKLKLKGGENIKQHFNRLLSSSVSKKLGKPMTNNRMPKCKKNEKYELATSAIVSEQAGAPELLAALHRPGGPGRAPRGGGYPRSRQPPTR